MRPLFTVAFVLGLCCLPVQSLAQGTAQSKGKPVIVIEPDYILLPGGIEGQWDAAQVVIVGRVVTSKKDKKVEAPNVVLPSMVHTFKVEDVFKANGNIDKGTRIEVVQDAGTVEEADRIYTIPSRVFEPFKPGSRYALFLTRYEGKYLLTAGRDSVLELTEGRAKTQGNLSSQAESDLLAKLRQLAAR